MRYTMPDYFDHAALTSNANQTRSPDTQTDQLVIPLLRSAYRLLSHLGITENYKGFHYAAYAATLCALDQGRLILVTKWLYPDVAKRFSTDWTDVERDLRTIINVAWKQNRNYLSTLAQVPLTRKPVCAQFLSILASNLRPDDLLPTELDRF